MRESVIVGIHYRLHNGDAYDVDEGGSKHDSLQQHKLLRLRERIRLQPRKIDSRCQRAAVKCHAMISGFNEAVLQHCNFAIQQIKDMQRNVSRLRQIVSNRRCGIERIGIILAKNKFPWERYVVFIINLCLVWRQSNEIDIAFTCAERTCFICNDISAIRIYAN